MSGYKCYTCGTREMSKCNYSSFNGHLHCQACAKVSISQTERSFYQVTYKNGKVKRFYCLPSEIDEVASKRFKSPIISIVKIEE